MAQIYLPKQVDIQNIKYSPPKLNTFGGKAIYVAYQKHPLIIQTPEMSIPFGIGIDKPNTSTNSSSNTKYSLNLSFRGLDTNTNVRQLHDLLNNLDNKILQDAHTYRKDWFGNTKHTLEVIKALYSPIVRYSKDKETGNNSYEFPPTLRVKIPYRNNKFGCSVFNTNKEEVDPNELESILVKGSRVKALIQPSQIWFSGGKFGLAWKVVQLLVHPPSKIDGYSFINEDESDTEENYSDSE